MRTCARVKGGWGGSQAKGLEWPVVFVPRFHGGFFPISRPRSPHPGDDDGEGETEEEEAERAAAAESLEEEQRLAHVAFTRARERLYVSRIRRLEADARTRRFGPSVIPLPPGGPAGGGVVRETWFPAGLARRAAAAARPQGGRA